ncbi:MAG: hypothetical protein PF549_04155, partial [Patescibacteria group bacterium]|nr:hypothetical protein [Patescibacteria group bacterium]
VPEKARFGDENKDIELKLGNFLIEKGYIRETEYREEDWGFVYYSFTKIISISKTEMPHQTWEDCVFKMGRNKEIEEDLFPAPGVETEKYRFLHEINHAYQEYLCSKESPEDPKEWYQKSLQGEVSSCYSKLFYFCFQKREEIETNKKENELQKGISIWGNAENYNYKNNKEIPNKISELAVRAQEDANEMITMFLWHPFYFNTYIDYLSLNYQNREVRERELTREDLERQNLISISKEEASNLKKIVRAYVKEMKENIG